jgi:hypothetical protein
LEPSLDEHCYGESLARAGGHLEQHSPPTGKKRIIGGLEASQLIRSGIDIFALKAEARRKRYSIQSSLQSTSAMLAQIGAPFEVCA